MSDQGGGGGPPKRVPEPRQQPRGEEAPVERSVLDALGVQGLEDQVPEATQPAADQPGPEGPGTLLAAQRTAQGLGVGDIARQLKLSVRQVEALERDDYDAFAGMVFVRGFVRNYAKLLDLDPEPLVAMTYEESSAEEAVAPPLADEQDIGRPGGANRGWLLGAVVLIALLVAAIYEGRHRQPPPGVFEPPAPVSGGGQQAESPAPQREAPRAALEPAPAAAVPESPQHAEAPPPERGPPAAVEQAAPPAVPAARDAANVAPVAAPPAAEPAAAPSTAEAPATGEQKLLRIAFDGASWVEVKDAAGAVIFSQLNDPGTERVVRGRAPLSVVIGNAHSVRLSYGDRPVDLDPHTNVDVARLVLE
jgi:cytoskeleton protein RodZ